MPTCCYEYNNMLYGCQENLLISGEYVCNLAIIESTTEKSYDSQNGEAT